MHKSIILQKYIAESGQFSRRQAKELIRYGKVLVNGKRAELGMRVGEEDEVKIDGTLLRKAEEKKYIMLNKPAGYTCTNKKFISERNIFELLDIRERLFAVGRLDKNSRGLVLLTNDGDLAYKLTHPKFEHEKEYRVQLRIKNDGNTISVKEADMIVEKLVNGIDIGDCGGIARAKEARFIGKNELRLILTEGKKRQVRRMFEAMGFRADDLIRTRIAFLQLSVLPEGKWRYLDADEIEKMKETLI